MNEDFLIYPIVKKTASFLASAGGWLLIICAALSTLEIGLVMSGFLTGGVLCGLLSSHLFLLTLIFLATLILWCHYVLLGERGNEFSRWICLIGTLFVILLPASLVYTYFTGDLLAEGQDMYPYIICIILLQAAWLNIPKMATAPLSLRIRVALFPILLLGILVTDVPGFLPIALLFKIGAAALMSGPLFQLARIAPRIISMPEAQQKPTVNE